MHRWNIRAFLPALAVALALVVCAIAFPLPAHAVSFTDSLTASNPTQTGRVSRNGTASTCAAVKAFPSINTANGARHYAAYTYQNTTAATQCVTVKLTLTCGLSGALFSVAYLGSFAPTNLASNYLADPGSSQNLNVPSVYSFNLTAGQTAVVVVHELSPGTTGCLDYSLVIGVLAVPQTITFGPIVDHTFGNPPFVVSATADSGLPVSFTAASTPAGSCSVSSGVPAAGSGTVTISGVGSCTVTAHQAGSANYLAAPDVSKTFTILKASANIMLLSANNPALAGQKVVLVATMSSTAGTPTGSVTFYDGTSPLGTATLSNGRASLMAPTLSWGTHSITAMYGGDTTFLGSTSRALQQVVYGWTASGVDTVTAHVGMPLTGQLVATFSDDDPNPAVHHYTASIDWGDGSTSSGVISALGASSFVVRGTHTYSTTTAHTITVTITAADGRTVQALTGVSVSS